MGRDITRLGFLATRKKGGGPSRAIILQSAVSLIMMNLAGFEQLLIYIGFTLSIFGALTVGSVFLLRRSDRDLPFRAPGYPVVPLLFVALMLWMIVNGLMAQPRAARAGLVTLLFGLLVYALSRALPAERA